MVNPFNTIVCAVDAVVFPLTNYRGKAHSVKDPADLESERNPTYEAHQSLVNKTKI